MNEQELNAVKAYIAKLNHERAILEDLDHPDHGTRTGYKAGCRCVRCANYTKMNPPTTMERKLRAAARRKITSQAKAKELRSNPDDSRHGKNSSYMYGCRCDKCKAAHAKAVKDWRKKQQ